MSSTASDFRPAAPGGGRAGRPYYPCGPGGSPVMKLGLGLYPRLLTPENLRFARQIGVSHVVAHLPDWTSSGVRGVEAPGGRSPIWSYEELRDLRQTIIDAGLELAAIENFEPAHWYDVLLDG